MGKDMGNVGCLGIRAYFFMSGRNTQICMYVRAQLLLCLFVFVRTYICVNITACAFVLVFLCTYKSVNIISRKYTVYVRMLM